MNDVIWVHNSLRPYVIITLHGYIWICMTLYLGNFLWESIMLCDSVLLWMVLYDTIQPFDTLHDYVWLCKNQYNIVWLLLTLFELVSQAFTLFCNIRLHLPLPCFVELTVLDSVLSFRCISILISGKFTDKLTSSQTLSFV